MMKYTLDLTSVFPFHASDTCFVSHNYEVLRHNYAIVRNIYEIVSQNYEINSDRGSQNIVQDLCSDAFLSVGGSMEPLQYSTYVQ